MALLQALCMFIHLPAGFRNKDIRPIVASLLGLEHDAYTRGMMTYDLRRLRLKGLIRRRPKSHSYDATNIGLRVALFYTKLNCRLLRPGWAAIAPSDPIPRKLDTAFSRVEAEIDRCCERARLQAAA